MVEETSVGYVKHFPKLGLARISVWSEHHLVKDSVNNLSGRSSLIVSSITGGRTNESSSFMVKGFIQHGLCCEVTERGGPNSHAAINAVSSLVQGSFAGKHAQKTSITVRIRNRSVIFGEF